MCITHVPKKKNTKGASNYSLIHFRRIQYIGVIVCMYNEK